MKIVKLIVAIFAVISFFSCKAQSQFPEKEKTNKTENKYAEGKMVNGTYFIINAKENIALEPYQRQYSGLNDINLVKLDKDAIQKWVLKENIDAKTKKPNGTFSIYLFVNQTFAITNKYNNPRIGKTNQYPKDNFILEYNEIEKAYTIKSLSAKGDCIGKKEGRFAKFVPNDGSKENLWKFLKTE